MRRVILGMLASVVWGGLVQADEPRIFRLAGLPEDLVPLRLAVYGRTGLLAVSPMGLALPRGSAWTFVPPPGPDGLLAAAEHPLGVVVATGQGAWLQDGRAWRRLPIEGLVPGRVLRAGDAVFLANLHAVYRVGPDGGTSEVLRFPESVALSSMYLTGGEVVALTWHPRQAFRWDGHEFRRAPAIEEFMTESRPALHMLLEGRPEGVFFNGDAFYPHAPPGANLDAMRRIAAEFHPANPFARTLVAGRYFYGVSTRGVECYRLADGTQHYLIANATLGAEAGAVTWGPEGLFIIASNGVSVVPDPDYVRYAPTPPSGSFYARVQTKSGALVLNMNGAHYEDGRPALDLPTTKPLAGLETSGGDLVLADLEALYWGDRRIPVPEFASGMGGLTELSPRQVLAVSLLGPIAVSADGTVHRSPITEKINYLAVLQEAGRVLVVTQGEAILLDAADLSEVKRFGRDIGAFFPTDRAETTRLVAADGTWYTGAGAICLRGRPWPFSILLSVFELDGRWIVYGTLKDGRRLLAEVDLATGGLTPLDVPMHVAALKVAETAGRLTVTYPSETMTLQTEPRRLAPPRVEATLESGGKPLAPDALLPTEVDEVQLRLPRARVVPWTNPRYAVLIGDGPWQDVPAGSVVPVPRLAYGRTPVRVRAADALWTRESQLVIRRRWPWWARWPGWLLCGLAVGGVGYGVSLWRVRRVARRNRELEGIVTARTQELEVARRRAEEASAVKGDFIASMNHEIRNPMNGIVGLARILSDGETHPRRRLLLGTLESCTEQLRLILDDVLDFSLIERGVVTLQPSDFEWCALIRSCAAALDPEGGAFVLALPAEGEAVRGDAGKVRQILANFLGNALKYGQPPGARVRLRLEGSGEALRRARVEVFSRGPTLDGQERDRLFGMFFRGARARETGAPGTGLGLALCRRLAEAMGGTVGIDPVEEGNSFWLELALPAAGASLGGDRSDEAAMLRGRRVLAIEDETYNRLVLDHYLKRHGLLVDWASTAADAVALIRQQAYEAVLTDWFLPDAAGAELLGRLRTAADGKFPPVIAMSAYATQEKRSEILAAGAVAFVPKPVDDRRLVAVLAQVLGGSEAPAAVEGAGEEAIPTPGPINLARLAALGELREVASRFAEEFDRGWAGVRRIWLDAPETAVAVLHRLRSQALVVEARVLARKMGLLESSLQSEVGRASAAALVEEIDREIAALLLELRLISRRPADDRPNR